MDAAVTSATVSVADLPCGQSCIFPQSFCSRNTMDRHADIPTLRPLCRSCSKSVCLPAPGQYRTWSKQLHQGSLSLSTITLRTTGSRRRQKKSLWHIDWFSHADPPHHDIHTFMFICTMVVDHVILHLPRAA